MLEKRNGFFTVGSALLVRPVGGPLDVFDWNDEEGWRKSYGGAADRLIFFGEDLFGGQFAVADDCIVTFDPETGRSQEFSSSIEEWAERVLDDFDYVSGYPLAAEWEEINGSIPTGMRLMPRVPFIAGGEFAIDNLVTVEHDRRMDLGAQLARVVEDTPDGEQIVMPYLI